MHIARSVAIFILGIFCVLLAGCPNRSHQQSAAKKSLLHFVDLSDPTDPKINDDIPLLSAADNEHADFVLQIEPGPKRRTLRIQSAANSIGVSAYQILSVPADLNRADFIRENGRSTDKAQIPRVLLPLELTNGVIDLSTFHDADQPALIWVELHVSQEANPGDYRINCEFMDSVLSVPLSVENSDSTALRALQVVAQLDWATLTRLYPTEFAGVTPRVLNRRDPHCTAAVRVIDQLVRLGQENGVTVVVPRLQPTVKWLSGGSPQIDWGDFDSLVSPWLSGNSPLGYWPLPSPDLFETLDSGAQTQYWKQAAEHFQQKGWLARSPVVLSNESVALPNTAQTILLCAQAQRALAAHPKLRVQLPLEPDQIRTDIAADPEMMSRLITLRDWLSTAGKPGGGEYDIRAWAWRAFLNNASTIVATDPLISDTTAPADPLQMIWFYPGKSFGVDKPLPTIQLKWLGNARQDFAKLQHARLHGEGETALRMARLLISPVTQSSDIADDLFSGTTDTQAWAQAQSILTDPVSATAIRWAEPLQHARPLVRSVDWLWDTGNWLVAQVGLDVYNPADEHSTSNQVQWTALAGGWLAQPEPLEAPPIQTSRVARVNAEARFNLDQITSASRRPLELTFVDGFISTRVPCRIVLPIAISDHREKPLAINGSLDDWLPADAIQLDQPLVRMLNRPAVHRPELQFADLPASIFTAWSEDNLYIAFRLGGMSTTDLRSIHNFVDYQSRRAWGEDLCELLLRPMYVDNTLGPLLHIVCKPSGPWVERKLADSWQPFEGAGVRYASNVDSAAGIWRGEIAIPWKSIVSAGHGRPSLLRFNFIQHQNATGQSASWAGPIDFGRDDQMMGLIHLRDSNALSVNVRHN